MCQMDVILKLQLKPRIVSTSSHSNILLYSAPVLQRFATEDFRIDSRYVARELIPYAALWPGEG